MHCASCGTENRTGSRFCDSCGTPLSAACPSCGEPNRSDARFCAGCGHAFGADAPAAANAPTSAPATAERRLVSVLFADLVGFTTLAEDRDPEAVRDLLSRYFDAATSIVELHGGTVEKFIGDAVMAVWGTPIAHEDDAERAVRAGIEVVTAVGSLHPALQARAGVMTGEAAVTLGATNQGMVAGDLVNTAARLQGVAEAGTVLVGDVTRRAAERAIVFEALGEHSLKGKTSPVPAWRALRVVAQRGGQGRADALESPFVGRDEELRQLKEHLHAVGRERRPRLVSITGPAGIGKSRLVWELEKYADGVSEDFYWHRGRSPSYGEGITFWALGEMVRRRARLAEDDDEATTRQRIGATVEEFVSDPAERQAIVTSLLALLGVEAAPAGGRDALFPAWRTFFERVAERGTAVLVFEDLQWADAGLLDFIDHLLEWSRSLPIAIVTLARPELFDRRPDWGAARRSFNAMALEPLSTDAMGQLLAGLVPGLPESALAAIVERADGVPLYAVETVRALLAEGRLERVGEQYLPVGELQALSVPESLRSLVASRLDAIHADDRALLQTASVLGHVFAVPTLAAVIGQDESELEPRLRGLVRREVLDLETDPASPERGQFKFMQSLIREVAYATMGRRERRAQHLAVARHFEAVGDDELAGALASHYLAAHAASDEGPEADAVAAQARLALRGAAERAAALGAQAQAVAHFAQALSITNDPRERADLLVAAAISAGGAATADATGYAAAAVEAYAQLGDGVAAAAASATHGRLLIDAGQLEHAAKVLESALASAPKDPPELEAQIAANLARAYMRLIRNEEAVTMADRALAIAEQHDLNDVAAEALVNKGSALGMLGRPRESAFLLRGAVELSQGGPADREVRARHNLAIQLVQDDPRSAAEELVKTLELARKVGNRSMHAWIAGSLTFEALFKGEELDEHVALARETLESLTLKADRGRLQAAVGMIEATRGERLDEIHGDMREIYGDTDDPEDLFYRDLPTSTALLAMGDYVESYRVAMGVAELQSQVPEFGLASASRAAIALRDLERERHVLERSLAVPNRGSRQAANVARDRAAVAALEGRRADAVAAFGEAAATMRRLTLWYEFAAFAVDAVWLLPEEPQIRAWAAEARPILERMRAAPDLARLEEALGSVPDTMPAEAVGDPARMPAG